MDEEKPSYPRARFLSWFSKGGESLQESYPNVDGNTEDAEEGAFSQNEIDWEAGDGHAMQQYSILLSDDVDELDHYYRDKVKAKGSITQKPTSGYLTWATLQKRIPYYVPILTWLPGYSIKDDLLWDIAAGAAVSAVLIPQSMAMSILAGLPAVYGLYSAWITGLFYALLGNSRQLSIGPEAVSSILLGLTLSDGFKGLSVDEYPDAAHILAFLGGVFLVILGVFRFGFLDSLLSRPLLSGFINAVALIIILEQLDILFGIPDQTKHYWQKLLHILHRVDKANWTTFAIGIGCMFIMACFRLVNRQIRLSGTKHPALLFIKFIPDTLIVVILGVLLSWSFSVSDAGVEVLGSIGGGFPVPFPPRITSLATLQDYIQPSFVIAILGFIESIIVAKYYASKNRYTVSPNGELIALGMANVAGSFFRIFPSFGSLMRSSIADMAGARTQLYSVFVSAVVVFAILFLGPIFSYLPKVVLASIIIIAACSLVEAEDLLFLCRINAWGAVTLLVGTFLATVSLGVELGIVISLGISVLYVIKKTSLPHLAILGCVAETGKYKDISLFRNAAPIPGVIIVRIEESLYFANIGKIKEMFSRIEQFGDTKEFSDAQKGPPLQAIIIDARNVQEMDASAVQTICEMVLDYKERGVIVCFVKLRDALKNLFLKSGITDIVGKEMFFPKIPKAMQWLESDHPHLAGRPRGLTVSHNTMPSTTEEEKDGDPFHPKEQWQEIKQPTDFEDDTSDPFAQSHEPLDRNENKDDSHSL